MARPTLQEQVESAFEQRTLAHAELRTATLVQKRDEESDGQAFQSHRLYRTASGSYFLFICTAGQPGYLTMLTRERAQNALRSNPAIYRAEFGCEP